MENKAKNHKFKSDHRNNWFMHNPECVRENKKHIRLWDVEIQTDQVIAARRQDCVIVTKKNEPSE